jgi:HSP20 family protein
MTHITHYRPFSAVHPVRFSDIDDLLRGFFVRPEGLDETAQPVRIDLREDERGYTVHADLPGMKKEDIQVSIEGNQVSISAETSTQKEEKTGEKVLRTERYCGRVERSFTLAQEVDEAQSEARYRDGVLELVLPKKTAAASRRLAIQ